MNKTTFFKSCRIIVLMPMLLAGCATVPPPAPGSAASKLIFLNEVSDIAQGELRAVNVNDFLTVEAEFINTSTDFESIQYRFQWRDRSGMDAGIEENWKVLTFSPSQAQRVKGIATSKKATDFKIELKENN
jgi:uncharacterized protein YcfL